MVEKIKNFQNIKTYLNVGVCFLTFLLLIFSCVKVHQIKQKVEATKIRLANLERDISNLDEIIQNKEKYEPRINKLYQSLPSSYNQVAFFARELEKIALSQGENLEIKIDDTRKSEGNMSSLAFTVKIQGGYQSVKNTLSLLANLPYHTSIDSLKTDNTEGNLTTIVNFRLFMKK